MERYFLFGSIFLKGIFIDDFDCMEGFGLEIDSFIAFGESTCDNKSDYTFAEHFASLISFKGGLAIDFGDFLFYDFVDLVILLVHVLFEFIIRTDIYAQRVPLYLLVENGFFIFE